MSWRVGGIWSIVGALLLCVHAPVAAKTVVSQLDQCSFEVRVSIEVHGPRATPELVERWKNNIEKAWNGASQELIDKIAADHGLDPDDFEDRPELNEKFKEFMDETGGDRTCFHVNCCKISIVADVRLCKGSSGSSDYHQVEAVPRHEGEWDTAGSIPLLGPYVGEFQIRKNRSFVMGLNGQAGSTTGKWVDDPSGYWPAEAHEVGHLMGLEDQYRDTLDENGNPVCVSHDGHEHDLMSDNLAWPQEAAFGEILAISGVACDCCPREDSSEHLLAGPLLQAGSAIAACDPQAIRNSITDLENRLASLHMINMSLSRRYDAAKAIRDQIAKLGAALEDCDRAGRPMIGSTGPATVLHLGDLGLTYAQDSTQWCSYGPGTGTPPPGGDDPTDGPVPKEGDDPRDTAPPDEMTPEDDDPRDLPEQAGGDDARDLPLPGRDGPRDGDDPKDPKDENEGDDPRDAAEDDGDDPRDMPGPTVYVKAKTSVLHSPGGAAGGQPVAGQQVKLFTPSTDVALPSGQGEEARPDADFDKDPLQCTTDASGDCEIELADVEVADIEVTGGRLELELTADQRQGVTVELPSGTGSGTPAGAQPGAGLPDDLKDDVTGTLTIGGSTYYRLGFGLGTEYKLTLGNSNLKWEEDYCRDKQPGPDPDFAPATADGNARALPGARISFSGKQAGAGEARP